jgi:hypothetical protein
MEWANSVDPDQLAHPCHLIRIYTVHQACQNFFIKNLEILSEYFGDDDDD